MCRFCGTDLKAFYELENGKIEKTIFSGNPAAIYSASQVLWTVCTFGIAYIFYKLKSLSTHYEITTQRIKIERGYFFKVKNSIELFTVEHYEICSTFFMRLAGFKTLVLSSSDLNEKTIVIYGVEDIDSLADTLRECSFKERTRRKVVSYIRP